MIYSESRCFLHHSKSIWGRYELCTLMFGKRHTENWRKTLLQLAQILKLPACPDAVRKACDSVVTACCCLPTLTPVGRVEAITILPMVDTPSGSWEEEEDTKSFRPNGPSALPQDQAGSWVVYQPASAAPFDSLPPIAGVHPPGQHMTWPFFRNLPYSCPRTLPGPGVTL